MKQKPVGAYYETRHAPLGRGYNVHDANGRVRSTVWTAREAAAEVAKIDALGGAPSDQELNPELHERIERKIKAQAKARASRSAGVR